MIKKLRKNRKGMETVELVINLPIILYLVFASAVFLLTIFAKIVVIDAAREGARAAAVTVNDVNREAAAKDAINVTLSAGGLDPARIEMGYPVINIYADRVEVHIMYNQPSILPGLPLLVKGDAWSDNFKLNAVSIFKKEQL